MQEMVDFLVDVWDQEGLYDWVVRGLDIPTVGSLPDVATQLLELSCFCQSVAMKTEAMALFFPLLLYKGSNFAISL